MGLVQNMADGVDEAVFGMADEPLLLLQRVDLVAHPRQRRKALFDEAGRRDPADALIREILRQKRRDGLHQDGGVRSFHGCAMRNHAIVQS